MFHYRTHATQISTSKRQSQIVKSNEVRRHMLQWLNPNISEQDVLYALNTFIPGIIDDKVGLREFKKFAQHLIESNIKVGHFSSTSLRKRFDQHLVLSIYNVVASRYFSQGYNLKRYIAYLLSGLAFHTNRHYETRFLLKSLLHRKA